MAGNVQNALPAKLRSYFEEIKLMFTDIKTLSNFTYAVSVTFRNVGINQQDIDNALQKFETNVSNALAEYSGVSFRIMDKEYKHNENDTTTLTLRVKAKTGNPVNRTKVVKPIVPQRVYNFDGSVANQSDIDEALAKLNEFNASKAAKEAAKANNVSAVNVEENSTQPIAIKRNGKKADVVALAENEVPVF